MPRENTVDTYLELKKAIIYRITHINSGEVSDFDGFSMFRAGDKIGAAIPTDRKGAARASRSPASRM